MFAHREMKLPLIFVMFFTLVSCKTGKSIDVVIYSKFVNPQQAFEELERELNDIPLIDSLYLIGVPLFHSTVIFEVDTVAAELAGLTAHEVSLKILSLQERYSDPDIGSQRILLDSATAVPVGNFARFYFKNTPYRPDFFRQEPEVYKYQDEVAVKLVIYTRKPDEVKSLISELLESYKDKAGDYYFSVEYEFLE